MAEDCWMIASLEPSIKHSAKANRHMNQHESTWNKTLKSIQTKQTKNAHNKHEGRRLDTIWEYSFWPNSVHIII